MFRVIALFLYLRLDLTWLDF